MACIKLMAYATESILRLVKEWRYPFSLTVLALGYFDQHRYFAFNAP